MSSEKYNARRDEAHARPLWGDINKSLNQSGGPHAKEVYTGKHQSQSDVFKDWDDYRLAMMNEGMKDGQALLLPISVDIDGEVKRHRITAPQVKTLREQAAVFDKGAVKDAFDSYLKFFDPIDSSQSSAPPSPLDVEVNMPVVYMFHLPRENWHFTRERPYSVDNVPKGLQDKAFTVIGTFDYGNGALIQTHNWKPKGKKAFSMKYNLHVSIEQTVDNQYMRTDIIIDPGSSTDESPPPPPPDLAFVKSLDKA